MRLRTMFALGLGTAVLAATATPALAAPGDAHLSVLHAVPGVTVDVWVNGAVTLDDFTPGTLAGPLELAPGTYTVAITAADATDASAPVIGPVDLTLAANTSYTTVAFLDAAGKPTAALFTNDTSATKAGEGRLTVRHVAAAPAVDVLAGGTAVVSGLENGKEATLNLPAGTVSAAVAAAGTTAPLLGPADVPVTDGTLTVVYAWGSLEAGNLALATQTVAASHSAPDGVPTGEVFVPEGGLGTAGTIGLGLALAAAAAGAVVISRRTRSDSAV